MAVTTTTAALILLGLAAILGALHWCTHGRSSPLAALAFMLAGPVLGLILFFPAAVSVYHGSPNYGKIYGLLPAEYLLVMAGVGLIAAVCTAGVYTGLIAGELRAARYSRPAVQRPAASAALRALGLDVRANLEDVERAYRDQAMRLHPDRGGDPDAFKQLQAHYEQAKRHFARRGRRGKA
jgi:hypothetical protein